METPLCFPEKKHNPTSLNNWLRHTVKWHFAPQEKYSHYHFKISFVGSSLFLTGAVVSALRLPMIRRHHLQRQTWIVAEICR